MEQLTRLQPLKRIVRRQLVVCFLIAIISAWTQGIDFAFASVFGSVIVIFNTLLMIWHIQRAAEAARADAGKNLGIAYRCIAERWLNTIVMFLLAIILFKLDILGLMLGFILTQFMVFIGTINRAK